MEEKYGEDFTFIEPTGTNKIKGLSRREAVVSTERFPKEQISVMADKDENGNYYFRDNYVSFLLRDEIEKYFTEIVTPIYKDCKVIFDADTPVYPEETGKEITLEEYLKWGSPDIYICLGPNVDVEKKDEDIEKLRLKLKEKEIPCDIVVWYFKEDILSDLNHINYGRYKNHSIREIREELKTIGVFSMKSSTYEFFISDWR